jgi:hypothetical protein
MSILPNLLCSLLLTVLFSFSAPIILVGGVIAALLLTSYIPGLEMVGGMGAAQILKFLTTFGSGSAIQGAFTIGFTGSVVGGLFDVSTFFRYQRLKGKRQKIEGCPAADAEIPPKSKQGMNPQG